MGESVDNVHSHSTLNHTTHPPTCSRKRRRTVIAAVWSIGWVALAVATHPWYPMSEALSTPHLPSSLSPSFLSSLTVKELRERVKTSSQQQRGILSQLKRKQDLIDYLISLPNVDDGDGNSDNTINGEGTIKDLSSLPLLEKSTEKQQLARRRKSPLSLPPLDSGARATAISNNTTTTPPPTASPKDHSYEQVYARYPPLREINTATSTTPSTMDVRQIHHPVFVHTNTSSSDMDLVFVGTASCTPGTTRGVSCTALRLNWKRRATWGPNTNTNSPWTGMTTTSFPGGIWLFDVGECTQVRIVYVF
jgi:hypothetical protein